MEDHSNDLAELLSAAKKEVFNKNFAQAVDILEQVIESYPQSVEGYNLLAYAIKMSLGNTMDAQQKSLELMEKALEINPNNTLTLFNMASTYYEMEEFAKAINYYQLLVNSNRINDYRVYFNLAMCYEKLKDNMKATENYQQALKLNPDFSSAVINYSNLLMSMGKQTQAKYVLEHYLKNNRNDDRAQNNLNIILAERQIDPKVEENFKKISQNGGITSVYNNGVFLSKQQKYGEALNIFKSLVERLHNQYDEPLLLLSHVNQGVLYEKMNNFEMAIQKYNYIIDNFSNQINIEEFQNRIAEVRARDRERARQNFIPKLTNNQAAMSKTGMNFNSSQQTYQQMSAKPSHKQPLASLVSKNNFVNGSANTQQKVKSPDKKVDEYQISKPPQQQQTLQPLQKPKSSFVRKGSRDQMVAQTDEYQMMGPKQDSVYQHDGLMAQSMLEQQQASTMGKVVRRPSTGRHNKIANQKSSESDPQERQPQQVAERSHSGRSWVEEQKSSIKHDTPSFVQESKQNQRYERPTSTKMENDQKNRVKTETHDENHAYSFTQKEEEQQQYLNPTKKQQRDVPPPSVNSAVKSRDSFTEKTQQQSVDPSNFQSRVTKDSPKGSEVYKSHLPDADTPKSQVYSPDPVDQIDDLKLAFPDQKQVKPGSAHRLVSAESKKSKQQLQQAGAKPDRLPSGRSAASNQKKQAQLEAGLPKGQIGERRVSSRVQSARSLKQKQESDNGSQKVIESRQEPVNLMDSQHDGKTDNLLDGNYDEDHDGENDADEIEPNNPMDDTFHGREVKSQVDDNYEDDQQEIDLEQDQYINQQVDQEFKQVDDGEGDDIANPLDSDRPRSEANQSPILQAPQRDVPEIRVQHTEDHRHLELKRSDYENLDDTQINNPLNDDDDQNPVLNQAESKMMSIQGSQHIEHSVNTSNILLDGEFRKQIKARKVEDDRSVSGEDLLDKSQNGDSSPQQGQNQVLQFLASPLQKTKSDLQKIVDQSQDQNQAQYQQQQPDFVLDTTEKDLQNQLDIPNPLSQQQQFEEQLQDERNPLMETSKTQEQIQQQNDEVVNQDDKDIKQDVEEQQNNAPSDPQLEVEQARQDLQQPNLLQDEGQQQDQPKMDEEGPQQFQEQQRDEQNDQDLQQDLPVVEQGEQTEQRDDEKNAQRNQVIQQLDSLQRNETPELGQNQQGQQTEPQLEEQPVSNQASRQQEINQFFEQGDQGDQSHRNDDEAQQQSQVHEQQRDQDPIEPNNGEQEIKQEEEPQQQLVQEEQPQQFQEDQNIQGIAVESEKVDFQSEQGKEREEEILNQNQNDQIEGQPNEEQQIQQNQQQPENNIDGAENKVDEQNENIDQQAENPQLVDNPDQQGENQNEQAENNDQQVETLEKKVEDPNQQPGIQDQDHQVQEPEQKVDNPDPQDQRQDQQQTQNLEPQEEDKPAEDVDQEQKPQNEEEEKIQDPEGEQANEPPQPDEPDQPQEADQTEQNQENEQVEKPDQTEQQEQQEEQAYPQEQAEENAEQQNVDPQPNEEQNQQQQENKEEQPPEQKSNNDVANPLEEEGQKNEGPQDGYEDTRTEETKSVKKRRKQRQYIQYPEGFADWTLEMCKQMIKEDPTNIFPYFKLAIIYIELSEIQEAKTYLLEVHQMNAEFEAEKVNWGLGEVFESEKDWESALKHFKNVYPYTSEKQDCLLKIARCQSKLKYYDQAVRAYQKAVDINNKNFYPYYKLGWMQVKNNDLKFGIDNLLKASCLDTQNVDILIKLGEGYLLYDEEETSVDDAIETLMKGLLIDPQNYDCTISLAKAFEKKQDLDKAIEYAKQATVQANSNINSFFYLGTLYMKKKELKWASDAFRTLLKHNSEHVDALIEYATILSLQGSHDKAKKYFRHALKFDPNNITANLRLGKIFQTKLKDLTAAIECFTKIVKVDPQNYKAHYYIGICYMEKQDYKNATECMKESLKLNSRFNLAWKAIGNILYETNSPSKALKYFQRSLECDPTDLEAKIGLANCHYLLEDFESAINLYEEISHIDHNEELEYNLANCHYMRNDYDSAIIHYQKALQMNPKKTECYYNLGNAFCIQERFQEALECFENSIRHDPKHYSALYNLANTYYVLNDYENASRYFEEAIELQPDNIEWRNYVASLYLEKNDLQEAKRHIDESLRISSTHPDTYIKLSTYYSQLGNLKEAISNAKYALSLSPDNEEAQQLLVELER